MSARGCLLIGMLQVVALPLVVELSRLCASLWRPFPPVSNVFAPSPSLVLFRNAQTEETSGQ